MSLLDAVPLPAPPLAPEFSITDLVPPSIRERVQVGPSPDWVTVRDVDEEFHSGNEGSVTLLLVDHQCRAAEHAFYYRNVRRLETMGAVQTEGQWRFNSFDPATQELVLHSIVIRREGRSMDQLHLERMRFLQREAGLDWSFSIDGSITLVLLLDDVRVGDIIDASFTIKSVSRLLPHRFWWTAFAPLQTPVGAFHVSVRFPAGREMRSRNSADFGMRNVRDLGEETEWSWKRDKIVPRELEPGLPVWYPNACAVAVSDCASWAEVARGATEAWRECLDDEEVLKCARQFASQSASLPEQANFAITFVQDEIRYLSVNTEYGGQIPAAPGQVLRRRFGDCKDKSFLLTHLLRLLGIAARPVLVNSTIGRSVANLLPSPDAFDHAIVEYELEGRRYWVDPTLIFQGGDARSRHVGDFRMGLPLGRDVADLEPIGASPSVDSFELGETFRLDTTGRSSLLIVTKRATGWHADELRQQIGMHGAEAIYRIREQYYRKLFPEARRRQKLEWQDQRQTNEFRTVETYELPHALIETSSGSAYGFRYGSTLLHAQLALPESGKRRYPFALPQAKNVSHRIELESPTLPRGESGVIQKRDDAFRFFCESKKLFGKWSFYFSLRFTEEEIPASKFEAYRERVKELLPSTFIAITLASGTNNALQGSRRGRTLAGIPSMQAKAKAKPRPFEATPNKAVVSGNANAVRLPVPAPILHSLPQTGKVAPLAPLAPRAAFHQDGPIPVEIPARSHTSGVKKTREADLETDGFDELSVASSPATTPANESLSSRRRKRRRQNQNWIVPILLMLFAIATGIVCVKAVWKLEKKPLAKDSQAASAAAGKAQKPHRPDPSASNADFLLPDQ